METRNSLDSNGFWYKNRSGNGFCRSFQENNRSNNIRLWWRYSLLTYIAGGFVEQLQGFVYDYSSVLGIAMAAIILYAGFHTLGSGRYTVKTTLVQLVWLCSLHVPVVSSSCCSHNNCLL